MQTITARPQNRTEPAGQTMAESGKKPGSCPSGNTGGGRATRQRRAGAEAAGTRRAGAERCAVGWGEVGEVGAGRPASERFPRGLGISGALPPGQGVRSAGRRRQARQG